MTKPTEQLIDEILTDIEYALDPAVDEIVLKNAREKIEKIVAEAIERTREDDLAAITKLRNQCADELSHATVYKTAVLDELLSSLRDNPIKEK